MSHQLVILGGTSSIAQIIVPLLGYAPEEILYVNRRSSLVNNQSAIGNVLSVDFETRDSGARQLSEIFKNIQKTDVVVLNFIGFFGEVSSLRDANIDEILDTTVTNLAPFFALAKACLSLPNRSCVISFSGAGVGGDNIDDSSFGYLAAKSSMSVLVEAIQSQLRTAAVHFGLVAPGAFPSRMQDAVARAATGVIEDSRIKRAESIMTTEPNPEKLVALIKFLTANPDLLDGRCWSANFDALEGNNLVANFGKMRRVF